MLVMCVWNPEELLRISDRARSFMNLRILYCGTHSYDLRKGETWLYGNEAAGWRLVVVRKLHDYVT